MTSRDRRLDRALLWSRELIRASASELALARGQTGATQDDVGRVAGMSGSQYGRIERGELRGVSLEQLCRASCALGLRPSLRLFPD